ncbi:hypothetical protein JAAARDRAFT_180378, partial [Jaapia argillacea MUCL 33604]
MFSSYLPRPLNLWLSEPPQTPAHLCENCGTRPKFIENGHQHPFCGKTCARQSASRTHKPRNSGYRAPATIVNPTSSGHYTRVSQAKHSPRLRELDSH